ncbi:MAG: Na/Pi cotransporter family protein [Clostridia bacterium]|nr:Na/Pi cotransporter family protein [Clostridia bacterium]
MNVFDVLALIGGLCLFLFGMDIMGGALERRTGRGLRAILGRLTNNKITGFFTGLAVTSIIQSSSATTVMVVGFVNSGLMTLKQAISIIMGANLGTTVTAWLLSLGGISSGNVFVNLLKPTSFTPVLALIGIIFLMFGKTSKKKDTATILLGFATLMFGMDAMSGAVSGLAVVPAFQNLFIAFKNPVLGLLVGAVLTAIIQSSSASVGILQALSATGQVSYGAAIPIIMGQNIGTCVTAIISSVGTNKNAKRAAVVHLAFNVVGSVVWLTVFWMISYFLKPVVLDYSAGYLGIAVSHSIFNLLCTFLLFPASSLLEKLAIKLVPDADKEDFVEVIDTRLLATPSLALERCRGLVVKMAREAIASFKQSMELVKNFDEQGCEEVKESEEKVDKLEDILGTYLVKLSKCQLSDEEGAEVSMLLKLIGDFERISDHSVNVVESAEELHEKRMEFSEEAKKELDMLFAATSEILDLSTRTFIDNDAVAAQRVEPLEQVIDTLKDKMRNSHIDRLQDGGCTIEAGFVWSDLITNIERTSDHCSNIAVYVIDAAAYNLNVHESIRFIKKESPYFQQEYEAYLKKYTKQ